MSDLSTLDRTETPAPATSHGGGNGDHDLFAHYVRKTDSMVGYVEGQPIVALCGKRWVPTRDPKGRPVCADCQAIIEGIPDDTTEND